jgi:isoquinoline 1-oxidoreductase beta subunit
MITRRSFLRNVSLATGGLILACHSAADKERKSYSYSPEKGFQPNLFVHLHPNGNLTLVASRSEMGQGVRTSLTSIIADEMDADWSKVIVEQAIGHPKYGNQNTDGSTSVRTLYTTMRTMGATARTLLLEAARMEWNVPRTELRTAHHYVIHEKTQKRLSYGDLAEKAALLAIPKNIPLKEQTDFTLIGTAVKSIDLKDFVSGKATYGMDKKLTGMKYAVMQRCPVTFGKVQSFQKEKSLATPGVEAVFTIDRVEKPFGTLGGVVIVASDTWSAIRGREALSVSWEYGDNQFYNSDQYREMITKNVHQKAKEIKNIGNVESVFKNSDTIVESTYYLPHLVHAPMETPNTTAWVKDDGTCEVWTPTQAPQESRDYVADLLGIDKENVTIHVTLLGGAFGRKSKPDFVVEAVLISQKIKVPVQLVWTREDDIQHGYYHAVSAQYLKASLDTSGKVTGWLHRSAYPSITSTFAPDTGYAAGFEFAQGMTNLPYQIENMRFENAHAPAHVRIGWYRSVYNIIHAFAINVFMDELAVRAKKDPLEFRLDLLQKDTTVESETGYHFHTAKLKHVLKRAANKAGYGKTLPKNHGIGMGVHYSFYSYVACVVELSIGDKHVKIHKITSVIDCGTAINTNTIKAQLEGAAIFGISLAYYGKISMKDGAIVQSNYDTYQMTRMPQIPEIDTEIISSTEAPTGVGEPGVPPIAPAIINAIYNATGKRYHSLPLVDFGFKL